MGEQQIVVFAGPSLPNLADARARLEGRYLGPAAQGDVIREALLGPPAIILIDGYFERAPAVNHKEILWALDQGIPVYGAASLGVLRALELRPFGMIGIGEIFDAFVTDALSRDDEVALIHGPREAGYVPLSEPLVNIRWTLAAAVEARVIDPATGDRIIERALAMFYPDRTYAALLKGEASARSLDTWLASGRIDQKQRDALACLERVADDRSANTLAPPLRFHFNHSDAFENLMMEIINDPRTNEDEQDTEALERLRAISPEAAATLEAEAERDALALLADACSDRPPSLSDLVRQVAAFRESTGLHDPASLATWLTAHGLDLDTLSKRLDEDARIARVREQVAPMIGPRALAALRRRSFKAPKQGWFAR